MENRWLNDAVKNLPERPISVIVSVILTPETGYVDLALPA